MPVPRSPVSDPSRRRALQRLVAGALALAPPARLVANRTAAAAGDLCVVPAAFSSPLPVAARGGLFAPLRADRGLLPLTATPRDIGNRIEPALAFLAHDGTRELVNPTLVAARGTQVAINLRNALAEPTVAHWHGLTMDTRNDGNGETLIAAGDRFDYRFTVHNRAGLYWYHPHPHGATARQAHLGLLGLLAIEDDEELALRRALELVPGETEIPLVLHEWRGSAAGRYVPSPSDLRLGWYGDVPLVNFAPCPHFDVATRRYRLRILNAANARTFRLAFRRDDGTLLPFHLLGTDGGLLEHAVACNEAFISPAERLDVLVDFSGMAIGGFALLESGEFDPMHSVPTATADTQTAAVSGGMSEMHAPVSGGRPAATTRVPDGAPFPVMQFRIRERREPSPPLPARLSEPIAQRRSGDDDRPLRLGFAKGRWRINDRTYDAAATPLVVARAATETWLLRNYHTSTPHAMHLHGFQFRVLARETGPDQLAPLVVDPQGRLATDLGWKDTVLVWPGESVRIAVDFRHPFADEQIYLVHCHNLEHEDGGMMLRVRVG
jgi:suppressor of ftsI/bilirubin oxidase